MKTHRFVLAVTLFAGLGAACGGSNNGKLSRRVNSAHLGPVSAGERSAEAEAQQKFFMSEWQVAFTESQVRGAKLDIDIAKNELASAKLAVKNTKLELKSAEESSDRNAIAEKTQAQRVANLQIEVRKVGIERAKQNKRYLEKRLTHEQRSLRSYEAAVELARANSLKTAGIQPPNFSPKDYKSQHSERVSSAKAAKGDVDSEKAKLTTFDKQLLAAQNAVAAAEGNPVLKAAPPETKPMTPLSGEPPAVEPVTGKDASKTGDGKPPPPPAEKPAPPATEEKPAATEATPSAEPTKPTETPPATSETDATPAAEPKS